jgi:hypothetical protein
MYHALSVLGLCTWLKFSLYLSLSCHVRRLSISRTSYWREPQEARYKQRSHGKRAMVAILGMAKFFLPSQVACEWRQLLGGHSTPGNVLQKRTKDPAKSRAEVQNMWPHPAILFTATQLRTQALWNRPSIPTVPARTSDPHNHKHST